MPEILGHGRIINLTTELIAAFLCGRLGQIIVTIYSLVHFTIVLFIQMGQSSE
jgi:hypothetical protein